MPPNAHSAGRSVEGTLLGSVMSTTRRDSSCAQQSAEFPPISMERSIASFFFAPMRSIGFKGFQYMRIRTQRPGLKRPLGSDTQLFFSLSLSFSFNEHDRFFFCQSSIHYAILIWCQTSRSIHSAITLVLASSLYSLDGLGWAQLYSLCHSLSSADHLDQAPNASRFSSIIP